jgi:hypothetical protein
MDTFSHGLWGGVLFGRKNKKDYWLAVIFGLIPDLFSFGIFFALTILSGGVNRDFAGPPDPSLIPSYVNSLYNITHSLIVFAIIFLLVWLIIKKPMIPMLAWLFHICLDIFTHSVDFFPTPIFWPISSYHFDGWPWSNWWIFLPNVFLLIVFYTWFIFNKFKKK